MTDFPDNTPSDPSDGANDGRDDEFGASNGGANDGGENRGACESHDGVASGASHDGAADELSDADIDAAFAGFEQDFADADHSAINEMNAALERNEAAESSASDATDADTADAGTADTADASDAAPTDDADDFDRDLKDVEDLESSLMQMLGEKASSALLITRLRDPDVLAALSVLADVDSYCIADRFGAVAILKDLDGSHPEDAAARLTKLVTGLSAILVVNRAGRIEAHQWVNGQQGESFPPPIVFANAPAWVEDLLVGQVSLDELLADPSIVPLDSQDFTKAASFGVLQQVVRHLPGQDRPRRFGFLHRRRKNSNTGNSNDGDSNDGDAGNGKGGTDGDNGDSGSDPWNEGGPVDL